MPIPVPPPPGPRGGRFGDRSGRFPAKAPSCGPLGYPFPLPAVSSFFFAWRRKTKKASPESAKLLSAVLTTATAMSLRFTEEEGRDPGEAGGDVEGGSAGASIVGGGGVSKAGVRTDGNRVWMLRCCCAAASGAVRAKAAARRRRRRGMGGRGAIISVVDGGGGWRNGKKFWRRARWD